jgi:hypothetical protein
MRKTAPIKRSVRRAPAGVRAEHRLLTSAWTADVKSVAAAIGRFTQDQALDNECDVVLFELPGDLELHVNVTHQYLTRGVPGWAGPGRLPDGFVHNRRFGDAPRSQIVRQIREMVFAGRPGSRSLSGTSD